MLKVIVEIHPFGDAKRKRVINEIYIANVGGDSEIGHYQAWLNVDPRVDREARDVPHVMLSGFKRNKMCNALIAKIIAKLEKKGLK